MIELACTKPQRRRLRALPPHHFLETLEISKVSIVLYCVHVYHHSFLQVTVFRPFVALQYDSAICHPFSPCETLHLPCNSLRLSFRQTHGRVSHRASCKGPHFRSLRQGPAIMPMLKVDLLTATRHPYYKGVVSMRRNRPLWMTTCFLCPS